MNWQYRSILFEYQKDGLLGDRYIDDDEMEKVLNEQGAAGWELVSVTPVQEGLLSFFKRPLPARQQMVAKKTETSHPQARRTQSRERGFEPGHNLPGKKSSSVDVEREKGRESQQLSDGIGEIKIS